MNHAKFINLKSPILITGETGTGKSYLAKEIFEASLIFKEKFLTVHLASLKEDLLESELFGHQKGSFTGAIEAKNGYLRDVGKGTLFLDEIGELSLESQKKLLYLLEEKKFSPVGSTFAYPFLGRIIMATNKDLKALVQRGEFRADLYYRITVFELKLQSLRQDPELVRKSIFEIFNKLKMEHNKPFSVLSESALDYLLKEKWTGNFRELKNTLEYALVMGEERKIKESDFPQRKDAEDLFTPASLSSILVDFPCDFNQSLEIFEKMYLEMVLEENAGKVNETARKLKMSKTTLIQKAKKYQINTLKMRSDANLLAA
ncbi:MAG: sigma 54-interacting transcriptional regulator [Bdellovibrionales bacterium]|nr:sigma 54-interacting transcriptional regulator [Bdellovibrionales bacterium]